MSTIRIIYTVEPNFPASDQHPDAVRYKVGDYIVDALDGEPTEKEVQTLLSLEAAKPRDPIVELDQLKAALEAKGEISEGDIAAAAFLVTNGG